MPPMSKNLREPALRVKNSGSAYSPLGDQPSRGHVVLLAPRQIALGDEVLVGGSPWRLLILLWASRMTGEQWM